MKKRPLDQELYEITDFKYYLESERRLAKNTVMSYISDLNQYADFLLTYENIKEAVDISKINTFFSKSKIRIIYF